MWRLRIILVHKLENITQLPNLCLQPIRYLAHQTPKHVQTMHLQQGKDILNQDNQLNL